MKIGENTFVSISYTLKVGGEVVETVPADRPLEFVYGAGFLLPKFEEALEGLKVGDPFAFKLEPGDGYGQVQPEAVVDLPKNIFMIDGAVEEGLLAIGNQLPMSDNQGNRLLGTVKAVGEDTVTMDFNHPMAGKTLEFTGSVVGVREAADDDHLAPMAGGDCSSCGDFEHEEGGCCGCGS